MYSVHVCGTQQPSAKKQLTFPRLPPGASLQELNALGDTGSTTHTQIHTHLINTGMHIVVDREVGTSYVQRACGFMC